MRYNHGTKNQIRACVLFFLFAVLPIPALLQLIPQLDWRLLALLPVQILVIAQSARVMVIALFEEIEVFEDGFVSFMFGKPRKLIRWQMVEVVRITNSEFIQLFVSDFKRPITWAFVPDLINEIRKHLLPETKVYETKTD